ncbi:hypothetical protein AK812_SmicGene8109 [Symbiodinium microadriaticum]|uniref:Calcineurin-like phosphoesterase domain-containing protein n=1 Tax=Symbiodinium microadriaticum TaxID=2951 RepID=A0A1Q9ELR0_SYMMI|nr:hypothetical protein AK812_SmicGene8109 [Symbiodinium microadriaticum]
MRGATTLSVLLAAPCCWAFEVSHSFSSRQAQIAWSSRSEGPLRSRHKEDSFLQVRDQSADGELRILHITDAHVSLKDSDPPHTHRMYSALLNVEDKDTHQMKHPSDQLIKLLRYAKEQNVDLIALGGDIINYPEDGEVNWLVQQLSTAAAGIPFIYTAGNHERPIFAHSAVPSSGMQGLLYGHLRIKGVDVYFLDNSNYQVNEEQLEFARQHIASNDPQAPPAVLLLHMPLALPGVALPPKDPWPNLQSTRDFLEFVKSQSAPKGRIVALLTGHVHRDFSTDIPSPAFLENVTHLACAPGSRCALGRAFARHRDVLATGTDPELLQESRVLASGAVQYSTLDAAEGGFRSLMPLVGETKLT